MTYSFLLEPGVWEGEGAVFFPFAGLELLFKVKWSVVASHGSFQCVQEVKMVETEEVVRSSLVFKPQGEGKFSVTLHHPEAGEVKGEGKMDKEILSWTLDLLEGREVYQKEEEGVCRFHAQYGKEELYRREIKGILRKIG